MENKIFIFPTDTVYGIGASVFDKKSIKKIYDIKKRPYDKPLAVLCANIKQINDISYINDNALKLINNFMPGGLTIIVPCKDNIKSTMNINTVGIRIPNYSKALQLLEEYGPLATTSVNESGQTPLNNYEEILNEYADVVDLILPPTNEDTSSVSSTVVDLTTDDVKILRHGIITKEDICKVLK